jgi:hypothetical protein
MCFEKTTFSEGSAPSFRSCRLPFAWLRYAGFGLFAANSSCMAMMLKAAFLSRAQTRDVGRAPEDSVYQHGLRQGHSHVTVLINLGRGLSALAAAPRGPEHVDQRDPSSPHVSQTVSQPGLMSWSELRSLPELATGGETVQRFPNAIRVGGLHLFWGLGLADPSQIFQRKKS